MPERSRSGNPYARRVGLSGDRLRGVPQILDEVHRLAQLSRDGGEGHPDAIDALLDEANGYHIAAATREIRRRTEERDRGRRRECGAAAADAADDADDDDAADDDADDDE
jgi:hypothetical protein